MILKKNKKISGSKKRIILSLLFILQPRFLSAQNEIKKEKRTPAGIQIESYLRQIKDINVKDEEAAKAELFFKTYKKDKLKCATEGLRDLKRIHPESSFYFFYFIFGSKCVTSLKINDENKKMVLDWFSYVSDLEISKDFHSLYEPEKNLIKKYILNLREKLFLNAKDLNLNGLQKDSLARMIWATQNKKIAIELFEFYRDRNVEDSAKQVLMGFDPHLEEVDLIKKLNDYYKDDGFTARLKNIEDSERSYNSLKTYYNRKNRKEFLELLKKTEFEKSRHLSSVSRMQGWLYYHAKDDFKKEFLKEVNNIDLDWPSFFWILSNQGMFEDIISISTNLDSKNRPEILEMTLKAYLYLGNYEEGIKLIEQIKLAEFKNYNHELYFWASLIYIRASKDLKALPFLRSLIQNDSEYVLQAQYFTYRINKESGNSKQALKDAKALVNLHPLTFYGLLVAHEEGITNELPFLNKKTQLQVRFQLDGTKDQKMFQQIIFLVEQNLDSSFRKFIDSNLEMMSFDGQVIAAAYFKEREEPLRAIKILNQVWTVKQNWIQPEVIPYSYSKDLLPNIEKNSAEGLDPYLVLSLIRQESAFQRKAHSPSGARGYMQLLTNTAKEMASKLKMRGLSFPGVLYETDVNIKLGSHYLKRRISAYQGHIPFALASYNAGPGRMKKWSNARSMLTQSQETMFSESWRHQDLWVEELPWSETRFYVKAILRNYLLYTIFEKYEPIPKCYRRWNCSKD